MFSVSESWKIVSALCQKWILQGPDRVLQMFHNYYRHSSEPSPFHNNLQRADFFSLRLNAWPYIVWWISYCLFIFPVALIIVYRTSICSFIQTLNNYLLIAYYVPVTVVITGEYKLGILWWTRVDMGKCIISYISSILTYFSSGN